MRQRDSDADAEIDFDAVEHQLSAERMAHTLGNFDRGLLVDAALAHHHKFVAANAGDDVGGACGRSKATGD